MPKTLTWNGTGWFDGATPATDEDVASAATMGVMKTDPKTGGAVRAKSWPETIADVVSMAPFLYGGPEAEAGAGLLKRGLYAGGRAALTGMETVGSDIISAGGRKIAGQPANLSVGGEAGRFAQGTAGGALFEGARPLAKKLSGETKATAAGTEAVKSATEGAAGAATGVTEAGVRGTQEQKGLQQVKTELGASAPKLAPNVVNQETRATQNAAAHSVNAIHADINEGYKKLFAPYNKNPVKTETVTGALHDVKQMLEDTGRMAQVSPKARTLLNDGLAVGNTDPLQQYLPGQDLTKLTPAQRKNLTASFSKFSSKKLEAVPASVEQVLALQNRANDILRSGTENATSKSVAAQTMKATTAALDEMGESQFLTPAEKELHAALKGRTRSFYTDFGPLMKGLWKTKTPEQVGKLLFEKEPTHVIEQAITSAAQKGELPGLQRAFADYAAPEGTLLLGDKGVVAKLRELDRKGLLQKLYPGRYGKLSTWLDTAAQQKRLEALARSPAVQAQVIAGIRAAADSPVGKIFMNAAQQSLKPGTSGNIFPPFMARWIGLYQPIEAMIGMGMMKHNAPAAAAAFAAFVGHTAFRRALADDAFREAYYKAITNPNVQQAVYSLTRLSMGLAIKEMQDNSDVGGASSTLPPGAVGGVRPSAPAAPTSGAP
jgi:hypothetical protein